MRNDRSMMDRQQVCDGRAMCLTHKTELEYRNPGGQSMYAWAFCPKCENEAAEELIEQRIAEERVYLNRAANGDWDEGLGVSIPEFDGVVDLVEDGAWVMGWVFVPDKCGEASA